MDAEPAFGFWLFSLKAIEAQLSKGEDRLHNLKMYTPELGLAVMS
jgi:hypothetical protein